MLSWRRSIANVGALSFALTVASPSVAQSGSPVTQSGIVIFWNTAKCSGGYHSDFYSAHCDPGPSAAILDFNSKTQFLCTNPEAVDVRWSIPTDVKQGSPIAPSEMVWHPKCWKQPIKIDAEPGTSVLIPQYTQSPPPNNYMTLNAIALYDAAKTTIKLCLIPLFPGLPVEPVCADAEVAS